MRQPKGFMFDLDGTLILSDRKLGGYTVIPGAAAMLAPSLSRPMTCNAKNSESTKSEA